VPTVVIPVGPMVVGHHKGEVLGACTDCRRLWGKFRAGEIDEQEIEAVNGRLAPSVGTCMVMGTASTMACITEALGLSLPMSATIPGAACRALPLGRSQRQARRGNGDAGKARARAMLTARRSATRRSCCRRSAARPTALIHLTAIANRTAASHRSRSASTSSAARCRCWST
jgi:dihydroxy-acid dehydratase